MRGEVKAGAGPGKAALWFPGLLLRPEVKVDLKRYC